MLFGLEPAEDRLRIRALRAAPVGRATSDENRRAVFCAALQQFDELLDAAAAVGPASRPLPLYYALNQAGRAVAAAHLQPGAEWEPLLHGLKIGDAESIGDTEIKPSPGKRHPDSFSLLTEATRAPTLKEATTLRNLWAAIPQLDRPGLGGGCPVALLVDFDGMSNHPVFGTIPDLHPVTDTVEGKQALKKWLAVAYPTAADGLEVTSVRPMRQYGWTRIEAEVCWRSPDGKHRDVVSAITRYLGSRGSGWLLPAINQPRDVLQPLQLWWCLLYALSHIARYRPALWTHSLDVDTSKSAVPIEKALATAHAVVPRLLLLSLQPGAIDL